ncbi:hypothetical protein [Rhodanobacter sp. FW106-PBR-R2A-1-13]|uniref:hypothetical protein n=1 Tax=Rhodanobacter sp. FW106-PBR-R2A-1-13 TaxID=3454845 RepID=UPI0034E5284A
MKAIALTQTILAIAISSIVVISVATYYKATDKTQQTVITKASTLAKGEGSTTVNKDQPRMVSGSPESVVTTAPEKVALTGDVSVASVANNLKTGSTTASFSGYQGNLTPLGSLNGGQGEIVTTSQPPASTVAPTPAVGGATVPPPEPPASVYPVPSSPKVLYSMWGVNVVVSPDKNAATYEMGISCGINPPASIFNATVQKVATSGLYSSVITENLPTLNSGYYFLPIGTAYTVIGGMATTGGSTQVANMTKALPQSVCQIPNSFGVWAVNVKVRACSASGDCSAWSPDFPQFCNFNRC